LAGSTRGPQKEDPTITELLKLCGDATGRVGRNHVDDRNEFLPTVQRFQSASATFTA